MRSSWNRSAKARLIGAGLAVSLTLAAGAGVPALAQERLEQDFGLIKACAGDVWRLCSDVLPDVGKMKSCMQDKMGQLPKACLDKLLDAMAGSTFKVCKDQTYALCAAARCNVYDGVAYCQCEQKHGDSISLPFPMGKGVDVCAVNAAGADNKYMVSTYSMPEQIASPQGGVGVYTCEGGKSGGAYAQCDGGLCFRSSEETTFPGFDKPVPRDRSSAPARSPTPAPAARRATRFSGPIPATSPSSNIARATSPPARRARRSMSARRLGPLRL